MSLDRIASISLKANFDNGQRFVIPGDDLSSHLAVGQILKGRILRHIEGNRYSVEFHGKEKVVDSGVPLKTGELLYGRVVGLGNQIELERISAPPTKQLSSHDAPAQISIDGFPASMAKLVVRLFAEFGANLSESDAAVLQRSMKTFTSQESVVYAGLLLAKLGLTFTIDRLDALTRTLSADPHSPLFDERIAIYLASHSTDTTTASTQPENSIAHDNEFLRILSDITDGSFQSEKSGTPQQSSDNSGHNGNFESPFKQELGYALLNLQTDSNLRHRVTTIPLVIDGELVELNIGLVEQREARQEQINTIHRRLVFTLNTDALGLLSVDGTLTGGHVQLKISVENAEALALLDSHVDLLKTALEQANIQVDAIRHDIKSWQEMSSPAWLITHTVISNDSLDRRI